MTILVFQHSEIVGVGRLGRVFRDRGLKLDIRRVTPPSPDARVVGSGDDGPDVIPPDLDEVEGVISLGGPQDVMCEEAWVEREVEFLRAAHEAGLPVIGLCLGCQLLAKALGAEVGRAETAEWGFHRVTQTPVGNTDRVLAGIPWTTWQFQSHAWEVKAPPPGAGLLQTSEACKVQAFLAGMRTYGFQYHPECDLAMIRAIARQDASETEGRLDPERIEEQAREHYAAFDRLSERLFTNMASFLFPLSRKAAL